MVNDILSTAYSQAVNFTQFNRAQVSPESSDISGQKNDVDTVSISHEAKFTLISSMFPSAGDGPITVQDIEESLATATSFVEKRLQSIYQRLGISAESQLEFKVDRDGSISVSSGGSESEALEKAINADDELKNNIRKMSADTAFLEAIKKYLEFSAAYEKDPEAAVERYGYLLQDGHGYRVSFSFQNSKIDTTVEYV